MKQQWTYQTDPAVCSRSIDIELTDGVISRIRFLGGCPGNLQGIGQLVTGMTPEAVIERLEGVRCGGKPTSCPDQLARALKQLTGK